MGAISLVLILSLIIVASNAAFSSARYDQKMVSAGDWKSFDTVTGKK